MRKFNLFLIAALIFFIASCGKKETNTPEVKKDTPPKQEQTSAGTEKKASEFQIYKIASVEDAKNSKEIPNFSWDENGKNVSIADSKGKVLFINFWATWCAPCKKEMPELSQINTELKDKNFKMLGINVFQRGNQTIEDILKQIPVSYPIVDGNEQLVKSFEKTTGAAIEGVPTTYIVDKNGKIVETIVGSRDKATFMSLINKYL
ncbi:MAG: TlpA family protein disulfide reductase [Ignavibacteria bacterium]|nr:TlpA family protein disulfide reductase [Ignavibacteria bacterium]